MAAPQSEIHVCSGVRLDNRYGHTIYFDSPAAQQTYFAGKVKKTFSAYTFLRKTWPIQVQATMQDARTWNYLYFRNGSFKIYYYFITNVEYINDATVKLELELDVMQTYMFDYGLLPCFVERNHVTDDSIGTHTLDEGLELGELVDNDKVNWDSFRDTCILVLATFNPNHAETVEPVAALSGMYNGVFSGLKVWAVDSADWAAWGSQLDALSEANFVDGIIAMWMYPKDLIVLGGENTWNDDDLCKTVARCITNDETITYPIYTEMPETLNGYTPKNKKLLCYPYNMLYCTNNAGGAATYRFERFNDNIPRFEVVGSLAPDGGAKIYPVQYNGLGENYDQGLSLGGFPACAWDADMYKMWLAQNQNQHALSEQTGAITAVAGAATGLVSAFTGNLMGAAGGLAAAYSGYQQIAQLNAQKRDAATQPPQSRGVFSSSVNTTAGYQTFTFIRKTISAEQARVLDEYLDMYGYKLNRVMVPKINARPKYTFVKTVGCKITGNLCNEDTVKIESIYDNGITFWTDGNEVGNYNPDENKL